ncbi:MAG: hypothetical protein WA705_28840 [Candidatus Ozemobacteraceae bacterium]
MVELSKLIIEETGHGAAKVGYIGSVVDVMAAKLPDSLSNRKFLAAEFSSGFELASPRDKYSLGEALIVNGLCYATSSDKSSPDYNHTISGREFVTGGMFVIPQGVEPSQKCSFKADGPPLSLMNFYSELYAAIRQPVIFVGIMECATFHGTAIGKPPINGEAIFDHKSEYFPNPEVRNTNVNALVMGVLTNFDDPELSEINKQLEVVLYKNPLDSDSTLSNHAHVLTLKQSVSKVEDIRPDLVERVLHLFADGTGIRSIQVDIYTIRDLTDFQN